MADVTSEFPPEKEATLRRARRLGWWSLAFLVAAVAAMALVLGNSQAMKTAWLDNILTFIPVIFFLVGTRIAHRRPTREFPYGFHRVMSAGYLASAVALFVIGGYLLVDSAIKLIEQEHPTIGSVIVWGYNIWLGWIMIPVLVAVAVPAFILGRMKLPLAHALYDKVLFTDAEANKADWLTEAAAIVGVIGIGLGYWWADSAAAIIIAIEIMRDGFRHVRGSLFELIDQRPQTVDYAGADALNDQILAKLKSYPWVRDVTLRLRTTGHLITGEAFFIPSDDGDLPQRIQQALDDIRELDWRIDGLALTPVRDLGVANRYLHNRRRTTGGLGRPPVTTQPP